MILSGGPQYTFNPAISLSVSCKDQAQVDLYCSHLLEGGRSVACGWLTDKFGISWQSRPRDAGNDANDQARCSDAAKRPTTATDGLRTKARNERSKILLAGGLAEVGFLHANGGADVEALKPRGRRAAGVPLIGTGVVRTSRGELPTTAVFAGAAPIEATTRSEQDAPRGHAPAFHRAAFAFAFGGARHTGDAADNIIEICHTITTTYGCGVGGTKGGIGVTTARAVSTLSLLAELPFGTFRGLDASFAVRQRNAVIRRRDRCEDDVGVRAYSREQISGRSHPRECDLERADHRAPNPKALKASSSKTTERTRHGTRTSFSEPPTSTTYPRLTRSKSNPLER